MRTGFAILFLLLFSVSLPGQCPDRGFLWHRIILLRDSTKPPFEQQLKELIPYLDKMNQCRNGKDSTHALLLQRIGWLYSLRKDFFTAIQYTRRSIELVNEQKNNPAVNPGHVIKSYWNLRILYDSLKLESQKSAAIDSCISIGLTLRGGYEYALPALARKINQLFENGDYYRCIEYATLGETFLNNDKTSIPRAENFSNQYFAWKVISLIFLNKTNEAEQLVKHKIHEFEKQKDSKILGTLYTLYGLIYKDKGDTEKALYYFNRSFYLNKKISHSDGCAEALNNIGFTYFENLHQNKKALQYHFKALSFADENESLNILGNISNIYIKEGNYDSAFHFFQKAFDQISPGFKESDLLMNDKGIESGKITEYITGMILDKADGNLKKFKTTGQTKALVDAIRIYQVADRYFDKIKGAQSEIQSKLFWKTNNRRLYEHAIEACFSNKDIATAFYFFEKSRAILLNDEINEQRGMAEEEIAKLAQLKKTILDLDRSLKKASLSSSQYLDIQRQLIFNKQEQDRLIRNMKTRNPFLYPGYADTFFITLPQLRNSILSGQKTLLEIYSGDNAVYVLGISKNSESLTKIDKQLYNTLTDAFISFIASPDKLNRDYVGFVNTARQLYAILFKNIRLQPGGNLIISPDGKSFPFEALVINGDNRQPEYFINKHATSYTYSVKYLTNQFVVNTNTSNNVLGIAPVQYKNYNNLSTLTGSDLSLKNINSYYSNATNYILANATRDNFLQNFPRYNIIQLYTHAADTSNNNDPVIYFSDSALYLSDLITNRKPVTQLVILSACETANGKLYSGEGIFSFNRGFAALGIPAAVSNLWSVDNESTYRITELFYKYLSQELPTDIALQKAKLEFINNSSSKEKKLPYFWAGSILTGKVDTIKSKTGFPWKGLITALILSSVIGFLSKRKYFAKKVTQ